jgi:hypothetical protein
MVAVLGVSMLAMAQQPPKVVNAQFHTEPAGTGLSATVDRFQHSSGPLWLGYEVAAVPGSHFSMCSGDRQSSMDDECCGVYQLEGSNNNFRSSDQHPSAKANMDVLVRIDRGAVDKIRFIGAGCKLDGGSLPFTWLTDVKDDDSVAWLSSLVDSKSNSGAGGLCFISTSAVAAGKGGFLARCGARARWFPGAPEADARSRSGVP